MNHFSLPSFLFDRGAGEAGDPGDRGMASVLVGVVSLRSTPFFAGDSIFAMPSDFGGLLSPSGSGLVGFVSRSEWEAGPRETQRKKKKQVSN